MTLKDDVKKLIAIYSRRLQKLKEQQALFGISVDPRILIEIEDIEAKIEDLQSELKIVEGKNDNACLETPRVVKIKSERKLSDLSININNFLGFNHADRVWGYLELLLGLAQIKNLVLNSSEREVLQNSVYLHPLGLALTDLSTSKFLEKTYPICDLKDLGDLERKSLSYKHHTDLSSEIVINCINTPGELASLGLEQVSQAQCIATLIKAAEKPLLEVRETDVLEGKPIRLQLMAAFFRLANVLDMDARSFHTSVSTSPDLTEEMRLEQSLRQYIKGVVVSEREMRFYYNVPKESYIAPLKLLSSGKVLRTYLEVAPVFSKYAWLLPPLTSQVEIVEGLPTLSPELFKLLQNKDWLSSYLKPLTEVLGEFESSTKFSELQPYHYGKIRSLTAFKWDLGLAQGATYGIKLKNWTSKETLLEAETQERELQYPPNAPQPSPTDLYQWSIKGKLDNTIKRGLGFFSIMSPLDMVALAGSEQIISLLPASERQLALAVLYASKELYGEAVAILNEFIRTDSDPNTVLYARSILANVYEAIYLGLRHVSQFKKADLFLQESKHQYSLIHKALAGD